MVDRGAWLSRWMVCAYAGLLACTASGLSASLNELGGDPYPLDRRSREAEPDEACPGVALTNYRGKLFRYQPVARVAPSFIERLERFERVAVRVATEVYGRPPTTLRQGGAYVCRPIQTLTKRWSEHAFGNAIDVMGFDFDRTSVRDPLRPELDGKLAARVVRHWQAGSDAISRAHHTFLHRLASELMEQDVFRGVIGPPDLHHLNHLHCDMGPWNYRNIDVQSLPTALVDPLASSSAQLGN